MTQQSHCRVCSVACAQSLVRGLCGCGLRCTVWCAHEYMFVQCIEQSSIKIQLSQYIVVVQQMPQYSHSRITPYTNTKLVTINQAQYMKIMYNKRYDTRIILIVKTQIVKDYFTIQFCIVCIVCAQYSIVISMTVSECLLDICNKYSRVAHHNTISIPIHAKYQKSIHHTIPIFHSIYTSLKSFG